MQPFLQHHTERMLRQMEIWTRDPSEQMGRLVSEGTRPRLPWASRLPQFQRDPQPVLQLLEHLKDDPSLYVRRSEANNHNDIGKDHPQLLADTFQTCTEKNLWSTARRCPSAASRSATDGRCLRSA